jgi:hypothetical protein
MLPGSVSTRCVLSFYLLENMPGAGSTNKYLFAATPYRPIVRYRYEVVSSENVLYSAIFGLKQGF